ncbi:MAG: Ig domain-containing protein [Pirellula sp.]|nr:Ig domain-containing protein [Pirellula sp.]
MAMNKREKLLAAGVGAVVLLFVGQSIVSSFQDALTKKKEKLEGLVKKKQDQDLLVTSGIIANQKINIVAPRSLPRNVEKARADYMEWLIALGDEARLDEPTPRFLDASPFKPEKDAFQSFKFQIKGAGTIENATQLLYGFYAKDYLHRITRFDVSPLNSREPDRLSITLDCEVLALAIAKDKQEPPEANSNRFAKSLDEYKQTICERNLFSPMNYPPNVSAKKSVDAKIGLKLDYTIEATDAGPNQYLLFDTVGEVPEGLKMDRDLGKLSWSPTKPGDYKVVVKVTDTGIPAKSALQTLTLSVKEMPPPAPPANKFDVASQATVTALIVGRSGPEAWVLSKTDDKKYYLRKGDQLKLGGVQGQVIDVGANFVELETEGRRWLVGLDESLADAYKRGQED